uniref:HTH hxlR-type domain-containing protein n=1 Tax=Pseudomonas syringae TaxID=317 RepID=I3W0G8_PSESX|nr:hypothetical protein [Pseudomonas syringae]
MLCRVECSLGLFKGLLNQRVYRFGELLKAIPGITQQRLTAQLRKPEADGLVERVWAKSAD